jgi:hypothetical protein
MITGAAGGHLIYMGVNIEKRLPGQEFIRSVYSDLEARLFYKK